MVEVNTSENPHKFDNVKQFFLTSLESNNLDIDLACEKYAK